MTIIINQTVAICGKATEPEVLAFYAQIHRRHQDHVVAGSPKSGGPAQ